MKLTRPIAKQLTILIITNGQKNLRRYAYP